MLEMKTGGVAVEDAGTTAVADAPVAGWAGGEGRS
jgi:hypothetical protein